MSCHPQKSDHQAKTIRARLKFERHGGSSSWYCNTMRKRVDHIICIGTCAKRTELPQSMIVSGSSAACSIIASRKIAQHWIGYGLTGTFGRRTDFQQTDLTHSSGELVSAHHGAPPALAPRNVPHAHSRVFNAPYTSAHRPNAHRRLNPTERLRLLHALPLPSK